VIRISPTTFVVCVSFCSGSAERFLKLFVRESIFFSGHLSCVRLDFNVINCLCGQLFDLKAAIAVHNKDVVFDVNYYIELFHRIITLYTVKRFKSW